MSNSNLNFSRQFQLLKLVVEEEEENWFTIFYFILFLITFKTTVVNCA